MSNYIPAYLGGEQPLSTQAVADAPGRRTRAGPYLPGTEELAEGEIRVSILGSGNPWVTKFQAAGSVLMEVGNPERDVFVFDLGAGSLGNFSGLQVPVNEPEERILHPPACRPHRRLRHPYGVVCQSRTHRPGRGMGRRIG